MLEDDIKAIEAKMALLRPTVFNFPQLEILQVYAVQLHLKQLTRLLGSTRVETSPDCQGATLSQDIGLNALTQVSLQCFDARFNFRDRNGITET